MHHTGVRLHAASQNFVCTHVCILINLQVHDYEFSYYIDVLLFNFVVKCWLSEIFSSHCYFIIPKLKIVIFLKKKVICCFHWRLRKCIKHSPSKGTHINLKMAFSPHFSYKHLL